MGGKVWFGKESESFQICIKEFKVQEDFQREGEASPVGYSGEKSLSRLLKGVESCCNAMQHDFLCYKRRGLRAKGLAHGEVEQGLNHYKNQVVIPNGSRMNGMGCELGEAYLDRGFCGSLRFPQISLDVVDEFYEVWGLGGGEKDP